MTRLCLIAFHFGPWPRWLRIFLETCRRNASVDWLLFSDRPVPPRVPANVHVVPSSVDLLNARASAVFGFRTRMRDPYKLCDLRPAFGELFADELGGYDFWGHTDLDVVYGDLRAFLTDSLLERSDVVAGRPEYLTGHFSLYRNEAALNRLYWRARGMERVLQSPEHYGVDECCGIWHELRRDGAVIWQPVETASMTHVVRHAARAGEIRASFVPLCRERMDLGYRDWCVVWDEGRLLDARSDTPFMYFHLNVLKEKGFFHIPSWGKLPEAFTITNDGFAESRTRTRVAVH